MAIRRATCAWLLSVCPGWSAGCAPEEVQLQTEQAGLEEQGGPGGCTMVSMLSGGSVDVALAQLPRTPTSFQNLSSARGGAQDAAGVAGTSGGNCVLGWQELSVALDGRGALREQFEVPSAKQSVLLVYAHTADEPRWTLAEVDLTPAPAGQRRARFSNYIEVREPLALFFYGADDQPVGDSVSIPWGETWVGTIPSAATGYRTDPAEPVATPFRDPEPAEPSEFEWRPRSATGTDGPSTATAASR